MNKEESQEEYSVTLSSLNDQVEVGEICLKCYKSLLHRLESKELPKLVARPQPAPAPEPVNKPEVVSESTPDVAPEPVRPTKSTKELLEGEIKRVPSKFNRRTAVKAMREINGGTCLHHFKTFKDGKVVCTDAPVGMEGELASFRGCGEALSASQYTVSKPRHFAFGKGE